MNKVLLGTTALVAASFFALPALGQAAAPAARAPMSSTNFDLRLTGDLTFSFRYQDKNPNQDTETLDGTTCVTTTSAGVVTAAIVADGGTCVATTAQTTAGTTVGWANSDDLPDGTLRGQPRTHFMTLSGRLAFEGTSPTFSNGTKSGFYVSMDIAGTELLNASGKSSGGTDRVTSALALYGNGGWGCTNTITEAPSGSCGVNRSDMIDQNYLWVDGRWGKIFMGGIGGTNGANAANALNVGIVRTYSSVGAVTGADPDADPPINVGGQSRMNSSAFNDRIQGGNQNNKVVYTTPTFSGFRAGLVYTPDLVMENTTAPTEADDNGANNTQTEMYGQWAGKIGDVGTRLSLGYVMTTAEDQRSNSQNGGLLGKNSGAYGLTGVYETGIDIETNTQYRFGGEFTYNEFRIGGYYKGGITGGPSVAPSEDIKVWGLGLVYTLSKDWEFGAAVERGAAQVRDRHEGDGFGDELGTDTANRWDVGVKYSGLGGGRTITAGYRNDKYEGAGDNMHFGYAAGTVDLKSSMDTTLRMIDVKYDWEIGRGLNQTFGVQRYNYTHHSGLDGTDVGPQQRTAYGFIATTKVTF